MASALVLRTAPGCRLDAVGYVGTRDLPVLAEAVNLALHGRTWSPAALQALRGLALATAAESTRRLDGIDEPVLLRFASLSEIDDHELHVLSGYWRRLRPRLASKGQRSAFRICVGLGRLFADEIRRRRRVLRQLSRQLDRAA